MAHLGKTIADLKWREGLTWTQIYARYPNYAQSRLRSQARRYRNSHPNEYPKFYTPDAPIDQPPGQTFTENGNTATAESLSTSIKTLDDLIRACGVDTNVWQVDTWSAKAYTGWRANKKKNLTFVDGKISGTVKDGGIITQPLWSVTAKFVKIIPTPLTPVITPITTTLHYAAPTTPQSITQPYRVIVFGDNHIGFQKNTKNGKLLQFHDRRMLDAICKAIAHYRPTHVIINGDFLDLAQWSHNYVKEPEFYWTTQPALLEAFWWLNRIKERAPHATIVYLEGNHEARLPAYIQEHLPEAYQLQGMLDTRPVMSVEHLLSLRQLGVQWVDGYDENRATMSLGARLEFTHGNIARAPGNTAKAVLENAVKWRIFGHIHRSEMASKTLTNGHTISAVSFGCCCHTDGRVPGSSNDSQWQKRFGVVEYDGEHDPVVEVIPFRNDNTIHWRSQKYVGRDCVDELAGNFKEWNW
jgi:hypothetical protein